MNENKFLWIANIPSKCKEEDVFRVLRRHGDIKTARIVRQNSCFNLVVEFIDRSSASRVINSQNIIKGNILKVNYCDSFGNPWISSLHRPLLVEAFPKSKYDRTDLNSSTINQRAPRESSSSSSSMGQFRHYPSTAASTSILTTSKSPESVSSVRRQTGVQGTALKVAFTPPAKYAETQIKQILCHEMHKFGKTFHVNLLPPVATATTAVNPRQTRKAIVVFRRREDEEKAFLAYHKGAKSLFGSPVDVQFCSTSDPDAAGLTLPNQRIRCGPPSSLPLFPQPVTLHSSSSLQPLDASLFPKPSTPHCLGLPTRTLIVHGLTVGPSGPVSDAQLTTAFGRFGEILHVQMNTSNNSAVIEFVEPRGASRAMTTHLRDPLKLGGRPLKLFYTPSRQSSCLWLADLPPKLANLPETQLFATFSRVAPVKQLSRVNRSTEASALASVHTSAFLRLATSEAALQLLNVLRSSESPLLMASSDSDSSVQSKTGVGSHARPPGYVCSVDFASPKYVEKFTPRYPDYISPTPIRSRPVATLSKPNPTSEVLNGRLEIDSFHRGNHSHHSSSGEDFSCGSSRASSSSSSAPPKGFNPSTLNGLTGGFSRLRKNRCARLGEGNYPPPPQPVTIATFPSQRRIVEAPLFLPQKQLNDSVKRDSVIVGRVNAPPQPFQKCREKQKLSSRLSPDGANICESMYDKIKRRTEGAKERRKRPLVEDIVDGEWLLKKKKGQPKRHRDDEGSCYDDDDEEEEEEERGEEVEEEGSLMVDRRRRKATSEKRKRRQYYDSLAEDSKVYQNHCNSQRGSVMPFSKKIDHDRQQKQITAQATTKAISSTITRRSLGMSVPMAASFHTMSKSSNHSQRSSVRVLSNSTVSLSTDDSSTDENPDTKSLKSYSSIKPTAASSPQKCKVKGYSNSTVCRSPALNDANVENSCSSDKSPTTSVRRKCPKTIISGMDKRSVRPGKHQNSLMSSPYTSVFRRVDALSSDLSSTEENERIGESRYSKWTSSGIYTKTSTRIDNQRQKGQNNELVKKTRKLRSLSSSSSSSSSSAVRSNAGSDRATTLGSPSGSEVSNGERQSIKQFSPWRGSELNAPQGDMGEDGGGDSLDDFESFSANSPATPSTEAMESCAEVVNEEEDQIVTDWPSCVSSNNSPRPLESEVDPRSPFLPSETVGNTEGDSIRENFSRKFEDVTMLNCSKDESLNFGGGDAIGEIKMDDQLSPKLNESSDKSTSKSALVDDDIAETKPEPSDHEEVIPVSTKLLSVSPPKVESGSLPLPPPPLSPSLQPILSSYSSSSPAQSLCSACSQTSPSPTKASVVLTPSRSCATVLPETTACVKTFSYVPQDPSLKWKPSVANEKPPLPDAENRDLKRYVQSVIERVKAETVDEGQQHRLIPPSSVGHAVSSSTPMTSPPHPSNVSPPPAPIIRKGASPASSGNASSNVVTSKKTPVCPSPVNIADLSPSNRSVVGKISSRLVFDPPASLPSIPGVNACAPVSNSTHTSPSKSASKSEEVLVETKNLRPLTRRRGKPSVAMMEVAVENEGSRTLTSPTQINDPYEPNFDDDDDSPPVSRTSLDATVPLVVNTSLHVPTSEPIGPASSISSVTTEDMAPPALQQSSVESLKVDSKRTTLDTVDEVISYVCSGHFDMQRYLDNWRRPSLTASSVSSSAPTGRTLVTEIAGPVAATTATPSVKASEPAFLAKSSTPNPSTNNALFAAILNALQSIPGSQVVIGGNSNTAGSGTATTQQNVPTKVSVAPVPNQPLAQKPSTVVVGSSPTTISATTITFPVNAVFLKNVFPAASSSTKGTADTTSLLNTSVANPLSAEAVTTASGLSQQHVCQQLAPAEVVSRPPQSSTSDSARETLPSGRMRHGSGTGQAKQPLYVEGGAPHSNLGHMDEAPTAPVVAPNHRQQRPFFDPRSFTSPPKPPHLSPSHQVPPPPNPWTLEPPHSSSQPSITTLPDKPSRLIDAELVMPLMQATARQFNQDGHSQISEDDSVASLIKLIQHFTASGVDIFTRNGGKMPISSINSGLSSRSTPSPSQGLTASAFGLTSGRRSSDLFVSPSAGRGEQPSYLNAPRSNVSPPVRSASFDRLYPLAWQGRLSLKNAEASVALHFVQGNADLIRSCITLLAVGGGGTPQQALVTAGGPLRIVQRMRLDAAQLDAVQRKIAQEGASCVCVAFASGGNHAELEQQNLTLSEGFIRYMLEKRAAGIINVGHPDVLQGLYVVHIFPPCEFSHAQLRLAAPDLHQSILQFHLPHLLIVITTV